MMRGRRVMDFVAPGRGTNMNPSGDKPGSGIGGMCQCVNPKCNYTTSHIRARPCNQRKCPKCGSSLTRM